MKKRRFIVKIMIETSDIRVVRGQQVIDDGQVSDEGKKSSGGQVSDDGRINEIDK